MEKDSVDRIIDGIGHIAIAKAVGSSDEEVRKQAGVHGMAQTMSGIVELLDLEEKS